MRNEGGLRTRSILLKYEFKNQTFQNNYLFITEKERNLEKIKATFFVLSVDNFSGMNYRFRGYGHLMDIHFLLERKNTSMIKDLSWYHEGGCPLEILFNKSL